MGEVFICSLRISLLDVIIFHKLRIFNFMDVSIRKMSSRNVLFDLNDELISP